jgi:arabinofuranosyltransferase
MKLNTDNKSYFILLHIVIIFTFFYNVILNTWISEDGYIFFRYVNNLLKGYGPVFNIGERVEGFTSPLWLFLIYLLKLISNYNLNLITILLSYAFSILSIFILSINLFNKNQLGIVGYIILFSTDFIFDFSTSGFETPLIIFLTIAISLMLKNDSYNNNVFLFSFLISLSILTRPEFGILFVIFFFIIFLNL